MGRVQLRAPLLTSYIFVCRLQPLKQLDSNWVILQLVWELRFHEQIFLAFDTLNHSLIITNVKGFESHPKTSPSDQL